MGPVEAGQKVRVEGATLVMVYRNQDTTGPLFVYDALNNSMFGGTAQFDLLHPNLASAGRFTMVGADGQRGGGHDNSASNELTFFDGNQIAGPPVASSDWDGSDGWPLPQLWDTHTHNVKLNGAMSSVRYQASNDLFGTGSLRRRCRLADHGRTTPRLNGSNRPAEVIAPRRSNSPAPSRKHRSTDTGGF